MAHPSHRDELARLKRLEGQIRGAQAMIDDGRYCVDILRVLHAVRSAIAKVEDRILDRHLEGCVLGALASKSPRDREQKRREILEIVSGFRRA
jgi:DNA-binding FrmR family transcriptional regulator